MKITSLHRWSVSMALAEPYAIAYERISCVTNIFLRLETSSGLVGFGCAAPDLTITRETPESVIAACDDIIIPQFKNTDPLQSALLIERIRPHLKDRRTAMALAEMALLDILGKAAGLPLYRLLGGYRDSIRTSITLGILPVKETVSKAVEWVRKGFGALKVKGGKDVDMDIERLLSVRDAVGESIDLRFDANQGYCEADALRFAAATRRARLEFIEQPSPSRQFDLLGRLTGQVDVPVMADESITTVEDAVRLARGGLVDLINIKVMKVGGIGEALKIDAISQAANLGVMVGCMDESALGIAAGLHFALARPNVRYADLDGHLGLADDPASGAICIDNGIIRPSGLPGLGVHLDD